MDLFSVLNQRQLDQNSEVRRIYRVSVCYALVAVFALFVSSMAAPASTPPEMRKSNLWSGFQVLLFMSSSIGAYVMMVKALNVLCENRFILPSSYMVARPMASLLLIMGPHDTLSCTQRVVFVHGLLAVSLLSAYVGLTTTSYGVYLLLLGMQSMWFASLWYFSGRTMSPSR